MAKIFDGKNKADEMLATLRKKALVFEQRYGRKPILAAVQIGDLVENTKYLSLKSKVFSEAGAEVKLVKLENGKSIEEYVGEIEKLNLDAGVDGVMIQLPIGADLSEENKTKLIEGIDPSKDVDGMRADGKFLAPVILAVLLALKDACNSLHLFSIPLHVLVLGSHGFVGKKLMCILGKRQKALELTGLGDFELTGIDVDGVDKFKEEISESDIIVSTTSRAGLITPDLVKNGFIGIDVGAPKAEFAEGCSEKSSFMTPVPGGVGPLTIAFLLENLLGKD